MARVSPSFLRLGAALYPAETDFQAGKVDDKYKGYAETLLSIARSTDDFATLKRLGKEGQAVYDLFLTIPD